MDANGNLQLIGLTEGTHTVVIKASGYADWTASVTVKKIIDLANSGIVNVYGIEYAVLALTAAGPYDYAVSGNDCDDSAWFAPSNVNTAGTIIKIQLPASGNTGRTVSLSAGTNTEIIELGAIGSSEFADTDIPDSLTMVNREPALVLAVENISLEQYLKFIKVGSGTTYIKPSTTTVTSDIVRTLGIDAVSSATSPSDPKFDDVTVDTNIAVQFDLVANHAIVAELGIDLNTTNHFLNKWENDLTRGIILNKDNTLYGAQLGDIIDQTVSANMLPKYVKYLVASSAGDYGTKVYFDTHNPDSETAPDITVVSSNIYEDIILRLSEENETWFRYLTEISIPYSANHIYYYLNDCALSNDGLTLTLRRSDTGGGMYAGPTEYAGSYSATLKSLVFEDVVVNFGVVNPAPTVNTTWDDTNHRLILDTKYDSTSYFPFDFEKISINGTEYTLEDDLEKNGFYYLYIPYKYLQAGNNELIISANNYAEQTITATTPTGYVQPLAAPAITLDDVYGSTNTLTFSYADVTPGSDEEAWITALSDGTATFAMSYSYWSLSVSNVTVDTNAQTVSFTVSSDFSTYYDYTLTITVADYEIVKKTFTPVTAVPSTVTGEWASGSNSYKITQGGSYSSYLYSVSSVVLDGITLTKGVDYDQDSSGIEIYAQNFEPDTTHEIVLTASGYANATFTAATPIGFVKPAEAPSLSTQETMMNNPVYVDFDNNSDWYNGITKITLQRSGYSSVSTVDDATLESGKLKIPGSYFNSNNYYTLFFYADGYTNTSVEVNVVKPVTVSTSTNSDQVRVEFTASDSYFFTDATVITVNDITLVKDADYSYSSSYYPTGMYIDFSYFAEDENTVTIKTPGYPTVTMIVEKQEIPKDAPILNLETTITTATKTFTVFTEDSDWLAAADAANTITLKYGSYGSTVSLNSTSVDREEGTITVAFTSTLSTSNNYTLQVQVDGYRAATVSFTPYRDTGSITTSWEGDGSLKITADTTYNYFLYNSSYTTYNTVYINEIKVENANLAFDSTGGIYFIIIDSTLFSEAGDYVVDIESSYYPNFAPWSTTVTKL